MSNKKTLLPSGFQDFLPADVARENFINRTLLECFHSFGYMEVHPSLVEFEQSLDQKSASTLFKVLDPASNKMLAIRNDITPQIARIAVDRYNLKNNEALRLSYSGQVLKTAGNGKYTERQLRQTGYELINQNSKNADAEVVFIATEALQKLGLKDYTIDYSIPSFAKFILDENEVGVRKSHEINNLILKKDISSLRSRKEKFVGVLADIIEICADSDSKNYAKIIAEIEKKQLPKACKAQLVRLREVIERVSVENSSHNFSIDILETRGFNYHTGISYAIFSGDSMEEIARGGRYNISRGKELIPASGLTFLVNRLCRIVEVKSSTKTKKISYKTSFAKSAKDRKSGLITIFE
jgi:ATP phosphoribosyltransferase regulatory subunit